MTKERPIIMSAESVRAILESRKTQTRRVIKPQPNKMRWGVVQLNRRDGWEDEHGRAYPCPYGVPGDRLWVRETWKPGAWESFGFVAVDYKASPELTKAKWMFPSDEQWEHYFPKWTDELIEAGLQSDETGYFRWEPGQSPLKWRPSIFMPRWASRISLLIKDIRVERVQEISEDDAIAEGVDWYPALKPIALYVDLWDSINAKRGYPWASNPWVWVIEFERLP